MNPEPEALPPAADGVAETAAEPAAERPPIPLFVGGCSLFLGGMVVIPITFINLMAYPPEHLGEVKPGWQLWVFLALGMALWFWLLAGSYGLIDYRRWGRQQFLAACTFIGVANLAGLVNIARTIGDWERLERLQRFLTGVSLLGAVVALLFVTAGFLLLTRPEVGRSLR